MSWKNRTYFQGKRARPFAQAADGSRVAGERVPRRAWGRGIRRFFGWMFLFVVIFGAGLAVGLVEDYEAEEFIAGVQSKIKGPDKYIEHIQWRHVWDNYVRISTNHFSCRMECRNIGWEEMETAVNEGHLVDYDYHECSGTGYDFKYNVEGVSTTGKRLVVVFASNKSARILKLITIWEVGKDSDCPQECVVNALEE